MHKEGTNSITATQVSVLHRQLTRWSHASGHFVPVQGTTLDIKLGVKKKEGEA